MILSETNEYSLAFDTFDGGGVCGVLTLVTFALKRSRNEPRHLIACKFRLIAKKFKCVLVTRVGNKV